MKISDVIARLQRVKELHGDIDVVVTWEGQIKNLSDDCFGVGEGLHEFANRTLAFISGEEGSDLTDDERKTAR